MLVWIGSVFPTQKQGRPPQHHLQIELANLLSNNHRSLDAWLHQSTPTSERSKFHQSLKYNAASQTFTDPNKDILWDLLNSGGVQREYINLWCLHFWIPWKQKDHEYGGSKEVIWSDTSVVGTERNGVPLWGEGGWNI